jgi:hypothetical protein
LVDLQPVLVLVTKLRAHAAPALAQARLGLAQPGPAPVVLARSGSVLVRALPKLRGQELLAQA